MRVWHYKLLKGLPKNRLGAQLRECIQFGRALYEKGTPNHVIVNRVIKFYSKDPAEKPCDFAIYCKLLVDIMTERGFKISQQTIDKFSTYFGRDLNAVEYNPKITDPDCPEKLFDGWHNDRYMIQCALNLQEKFDCDNIDPDEWEVFREHFRKYLPDPVSFNI